MSKPANRDWYYIVNSNSPATQVFSSKRQAFVVNSDADYVTWQAQGNTASLANTVADLQSALIAGLPYLAEIRIWVDTNVNLASGLKHGSVVNGVTLHAGDLVGLIGQTNPKENGIYFAPGGTILGDPSDQAYRASDWFG